MVFHGVNSLKLSDKYCGFLLSLSDLHIDRKDQTCSMGFRYLSLIFPRFFSDTHVTDQRMIEKSLKLNIFVNADNNQFVQWVSPITNYLAFILQIST